MASSTHVPAAELFGCVFESMLYGYYLSKFFECMAILYRKSRTTAVSPLPFIATALLFIFISLHEMFNIYRNYVSFASPQSIATAGYQLLYWETKNNFDTKFRTSVWLVVVYISDFFMLYRFYSVWGRSLIVALGPFLIICANIVMGCFWLRAYWFFDVGDSVFLGQFSAYTTALFSITTCYQVLTAGLIAYRLWDHHKDVSSAYIFPATRPRPLIRAVAVIVESAAIYAATLVIILGLALSSSAPLFTFLDILPPLIGTVFALVIIRVSTSIRSIPSAGATTAGTTSAHFRTQYSRSGARATGVLEINLDRVVHRDPPDIEIPDQKSFTGSVYDDSEQVL